MPRRYRKKVMIGMENDNNNNRKSYNSSERWAAKREIAEDLLELPQNKHDMSELRWELEMKFSSECYTAESKARHDNKNHECTCPDPYSWSDQEVLKYLGLL